MLKLLLFVAALFAACESHGCSSERRPPCDAATAAAMASSCAARVQTECVAKGVPQEECTVIAECDKAADDRAAFCGGGK